MDVKKVREAYIMILLNCKSNSGILYLRPKVTLHFSVQNIFILVLILSKLNIAVSFKHLPYHNS